MCVENSPVQRYPCRAALFQQHRFVMRIRFTKNAKASDVAYIADLAGELTGSSDNVRIENSDGYVIAYVRTDGHEIDPAEFAGHECVEAVDDTDACYRLAGIPDGEDANTRHRIEIPFTGDVIGGGGFVVMAGPCAVENEDDLLKTARFVKEHGATLLRGGAFKPRTSPYRFQGIGDDGLTMLKRVREETGIGIITEAMEPEAVEKVADVADIIQIGSRNMQNFPLLKEAGRHSKPVLLKRGMSATLEEWLGAAEYILLEGNPDVILCERGIRTFSRHSRHTLDIGVIPVIRERSRLPVIVDPSHATGSAGRVPSMSKAALAAGADGLLVEVHPEPSRALSDSHQALNYDEFAKLMEEIKIISTVMGRVSSTTLS